MNLLTAFVAAALAGCGLYMALSRNLARLVLGLALLSTAVNLVLFMTGRLRSDQPPLIPDGEAVLRLSADPLPQALVLTAIVIGFALTVVLMTLVLRAWRGEGTINAARITAAEPPFPEDGEDADAR
ncbi:sodium:proton antiporter [Roseomonas gilardii subsp. gilardii]|uniref:sodium:proton antiporter n=1 Tax=Roseomonas gilardii TaxID=257708 RepID=UPI001FFBBB9E|nr:sodium:proton antiporter [Roseomonas gilardii]UPG73466.1 sodium:proton antiporter [Roseomonas gilardii subsp. gilardii]